MTRWVDDARVLVEARDVRRLGLAPGNRYTIASYGHMLTVECLRDGVRVTVAGKRYGMQFVKSGPGHRWFFVDELGKRVSRLHEYRGAVGSRHELQLSYRSSKRWYDDEQRLKYLRDRKLKRARGRALLLSDATDLRTIMRMKPPRLAKNGWLRTLEVCKNGYRRGD